MRTILCLFVFCIVLLIACVKDKGYPPVPVSGSICDSVTYSKTIQPIVANKCAIPGCHVPSNGNGYDFTTYAMLKSYTGTGGLNAQDPIYDHLFIIDDMPKTGSLTATEQEEIKCWLQAGAPNN